MIQKFARATGWRRTCSTTTFELKQITSQEKTILKGVPTSVVNIAESRVNKLHKGPPPITMADGPTSFWNFINSWGGIWMWQDISNTDKPKDDIQWVADGMMAGTLIWATDGSYDRKRAADLSGVRWIVFLHSHWATTHGIVLGTIHNCKFIQSRNAWPMRAPSSC
jgi:hypothetical protein